MILPIPFLSRVIFKWSLRAEAESRRSPGVMGKHQKALLNAQTIVEKAHDECKQGVREIDVRKETEDEPSN